MQQSLFGLNDSVPDGVGSQICLNRARFLAGRGRMAKPRLSTVPNAGQRRLLVSYVYVVLFYLSPRIFLLESYKHDLHEIFEKWDFLLGS